MSPDLKGRAVLVVEDEFLVLMDLQMILEEAGAHVVTADTVRSALCKATGGDDLAAAVLDVRLPDGEVFPVAEALRARGVPIVFHSGHARIDEVRGCYPDAAALPKPAPEATFIQTVASIAR
jgi:DNA-binding NtrC family response regulator